MGNTTRNILRLATLFAVLLFSVQCFVLFTMAAVNGAVAIYQGTPLTFDSVHDVMVSGMQMLTWLNAEIIPAFVLKLFPGAVAISIAASLLSKYINNLELTKERA